MTILNSNLQQHSHRIGLYSIYLTSFFAPFSTSLSGLFSIFTLLCWVGSGRAIKTISIVTNNHVALAATLLFALLTVGLFYSAAPMGDALSVLKKYRVLLFIPIVISMIDGSKETVDRILFSLFLGGIVLLCSSYIMSLLDITRHNRAEPTIIEHINHSCFMALLFYAALVRLTTCLKHRILWALVLAATFINVFYIVSSRSGWVVLFGLLILAGLQSLSLKKQALMALILVFSITSVYFTSPRVQSEIDQTLKQIDDFRNNISFTHKYERLYWWQDSLTIIKQSPIIGHGTGSFEALHLQNKPNNNVRVTNNPHNEFLLITAQLGIIGLSCFLFLLAMQFYQAQRLPVYYKRIYQGLPVFMILGCMLNSHLLDSANSHVFAFLSGALSALPAQAQTSDT